MKRCTASAASVAAWRSSISSARACKAWCRWSSSRWRFYQTTELGREVLLAEASRMEEDLHALREILAPES